MLIIIYKANYSIYLKPHTKVSILNVGTFFKKATINTKQKLVFNGERYQTPILNKRIGFILLTINTLEMTLNKNERHPFGSLSLCTLDEQEIQKVKVDLESLFSLKSLLISKGLYNKEYTVAT